MSEVVYVVFVRRISLDIYPVAVFASKDEAERYATETDGSFVSTAIPFYQQKVENGTKARKVLEECGL